MGIPVSCMVKPAGSVGVCDSFQGFSDRVEECSFGAGGESAEVAFDFGPHLLDRIEVGRVGRQVPGFRPDRFDGLDHAVGFVAGEIVHHDDVVWAKHWNQEVIDESLKHQRIGRAFGDHRRGNSLQTNRRNHRRRIPMSAGHCIEKPFSLQGTSVLPSHVGLGAAFVQENQTIGIDLRQLPFPGSTLLFYFGAILLAGT